MIENIQRFDYKPPFDGSFIHFNLTRAKKNKDIWIIDKIKNSRIRAYNRFIDSLTINVPVKDTEYGFRRTAGTGSLDITDSLDFIVVNNFPDIEMFFPNQVKREIIIENINKWRSYIRQRLTNVVISRRFDISAPGTRLLAYYSSKPFVGVDMWHIKKLKDEDAKLFCIWFNSTPNLLQIVIDRTETRGAWMKIHEYQLEKSVVINIRKLSHKQRKLVLQLFERLKDKEYPSILQQLKKMDPLRTEIDKVVLNILGFSDPQIQKLIDDLYPKLVKEIEKLKALMEGR